MKRRMVLRPRARADLEEIWDYTSDRWGLDQAEAYVRQLHDHMQAITDNPSLGHECEDVRTGYRRYLAGAHVLFYRPADDSIEIVRILHERMDYQRHIP